MAHFYTEGVRKAVITVLSANPNKNYAKTLIKESEDGSVDFDEDRLKLFADEPVEANEFMSDMANLIGRQLAYDVLRTWKNPYDIFIANASAYATIDELVTSKLADTSDATGRYGSATPTNPFSATKPEAVKKDFVSTRWLRQISKRISQEVWAGAFLSPDGLNGVVGIILKNMRDSISLFIYDQLTEAIGDATQFPKYKAITPITTVGDTENARKCYEDILALAKKMKLPSTAYNKAGYRTTAGKLHLFLNANYQASFDINVVASLFNSSTIALAKEFTVDVVDMPTENEHQIGFICDEEAIVMGYRWYTAGSIYNPATMEQNYWINVAVKYGIRSARCAVRLLDAEPQP